MKRLDSAALENCLEDRARLIAMLADIHAVLAAGSSLQPQDCAVFGGSEPAVEVIGAALEEMRTE